MKVKISPYQLFSLMFFLPYATASLFFLTPDLKQDSWIALLVYSIGGLMLQIIYLRLYYKYPTDTLATYLPKIYGKVLGVFIAILYMLYFIYLAARVLRDFSELILINVLPRMSIYMVGLILAVTATYGVYHGLETLARGAQMAFIMVILFLSIEWILLIIAPEAIKFGNIMPILEHNIFSIITKSWNLITFPYGETVAFTMLYASVNEPSRVKNAAFLAMIVEGVFLAIVNIMFIMALGPEFAVISQFPRLDVMRLVKIGSLINRFDLIVVLILILGCFYKVGLYMYVSILGIGQLIKSKSPMNMAPIMGALVFIFSLLIAENYPQHLKIGLDFTVKYLHLPFQIIIPIITLLISLFKKTPKKA